jgi:formylglycine-generating enzyme required for sulfatase activity
LAEGDFTHGESLSELPLYTNYWKKNGTGPSAVGMKKPVFYNGKPIYDLQGNIYEWTADWKDNLKGGFDPKGPASGTYKVIREGSWQLQFDRKYARIGLAPFVSQNDVGFRIVRSAP